MAEVANFIELKQELKRCEELGIQADFTGQFVVLLGGGKDSLRFHVGKVSRLKAFIDGYEQALSAR